MGKRQSILIAVFALACASASYATCSHDQAQRRTSFKLVFREILVWDSPNSGRLVKFWTLSTDFECPCLSNFRPFDNRRHFNHLKTEQKRVWILNGQNFGWGIQIVTVLRCSLWKFRPPFSKAPTFSNFISYLHDRPKEALWRNLFLTRGLLSFL